MISVAKEFCLCLPNLIFRILPFSQLPCILQPLCILSMLSMHFLHGEPGAAIFFFFDHPMANSSVAPQHSVAPFQNHRSHLPQSQPTLERLQQFFFIHIKIFYNISYILQNFPNYFATLQGRHHGERKTMTTPWPIYKDDQVNLPTT